MAYIPPHKRVSQTHEGPPPTPVQMVLQSEKSLNLNSSRRDSDHRTNASTSHRMSTKYADHYISTWPAVPSTDDVQLPSSVCLVPVCPQSLGQKRGEKQLILVNNHLKQERNDIKSCDMEQSWASLAETLHANLLSAFENLSNKQVDQNLEEMKYFLVARLGKAIFRWHPSFDRDFSGENPVSYSYVKDLRKFFHTDLPIEYVEHIKNVVIPDLGIQFVEEKELFLVFLVKLNDAKQPCSLIWCKCRVLQDEKKLEVYKIEKNATLKLVEDIHCLGSNVDLRLALYRKRTLSALQDGEMQSIRDLISSAVIDSNVEGGLKWPLGNASTGGQYFAYKVWHTKTEVYISSSIKLKVRVADRSNYLDSTGEVTREVVLRLKGITGNVLDQGNEAGGVLAMFKDALILIRSHFLAWDGRLVSCSES